MHTLKIKNNWYFGLQEGTKEQKQKRIIEFLAINIKHNPRCIELNVGKFKMLSFNLTCESIKGLLYNSLWVLTSYFPFPEWLKVAP